MTVMAEASDREWRNRFRIGGFDVKEPGWDKELDDETFNQSVRDAMETFKRQSAKMKRAG
ncbi:hypothetical protein [Mesorhizobium sp. CAU 1741]|uniref:hypothetical protein n=1 Tax=Mesorhizobium sp. CAU 1741 TaxID=3140366 RepID=UPI00325AD6EA